MSFKLESQAAFGFPRVQFTLLFISLSLLIATSLRLYGQSTYGSVSGSVNDNSGESSFQLRIPSANSKCNITIRVPNGVSSQAAW